ncbi:MAG: hypothetical protein HC880_19690, partial [Bacteroidia bacterium]|nr:hypothetical protein [Bacteroidia bacterium]
MENKFKYFFNLLGLASLLVFFTSCEEDEPLFDIGDTNIQVTEDDTYENNFFEQGEVVTLTVDVDAPDGIQIFQIMKVADGDSTQIDTSDPTFPRPAPNAVSFTETYNIPVTEDVGTLVTVVFRVKDQENPGFATDSYTYEVVEQGQGGGGGVFPLLREQVEVSLGSQANQTVGSYLATSLISDSNDGVYLSDEVDGLSAAQQSEIDITFGVLASGGNTAGSNDPALISPDARSGAGFNNPLGTNASATIFRAEPGVVDLDNVTASDVANNIDDANTASVVRISEGNTYSFINADGEKGYIYVEDITGSGANRTAVLD